MPRNALPLLVAAGLGMALWIGCAGEAAEPGPPSACWPLAQIVGPEDFEVDLSTTPPRLLVSSQDRRHPEQPGAVYAVDLESGQQRALPLRGRGSCSFHPHGVSWVPAYGELPARLYVVNHHDPGDATAGCFAAGKRAGPVSSIEVFTVHRNELRLLQRLADPDVLTNANDLVALALPAGDVYVTNPPRGTLSRLAEAAGTPLPGLERSKVVRFECVSRDGATGRCAGRFSTVKVMGRYVNGIAYREARRGEPERLYVSASSEEYLRVLERQDGEWQEKDPREIGTGGDNLTWADPAKTLLLAAVHPDARRFLQHSSTARSPSPSKVLELTIPGDGSRPVFEDSGGLIRAVSTAACARGTLILGQVFGDDLLQCWRPDVCAASATGEEEP